MIRLIINGCNGKMGRMLTATLEPEDDIQIVAGVDKSGSDGTLPYQVYSSIEECDIKADVIVDFSRPDSVEPLAMYAAKTGTALVIATTGLTKQHRDMLAKAAESVAVLQSANMSLGINLVKDICKKAARVLGDSFDIEVVEFHHNQKVDAPSGTAVMLAEELKAALEDSVNLVYGRSPQSGKRQPNEIGIHAIRGGTMPGEHSIIFAGQDEIVEIRHLALSRRIFAAGAIKAIRFIAKQPKGLFTMDDLIKQ
jgi:4-hydroxy-tetrahydrodipicolinate reductase